MDTEQLSLKSHIRHGLDLLVDAHQYATKTNSTEWDFAVEIAQLRQVGLNPNDLRMLVRIGLVEHSREVTLEGDDGREFRPTGDLTFCESTCFILTPAGVASLCCSGDDKVKDNHEDDAGVSEGIVREPSLQASTDDSNWQHIEQIPTWDNEKRELRVGHKTVKQFRLRAVNQETILAAFQEEGWPERIDDPLPPKQELDPKRRLHDTIKYLNRRQEARLIKFGGDGTGQGVVWRFLQ